MIGEGLRLSGRRSTANIWRKRAEPRRYQHRRELINYQYLGFAIVVRVSELAKYAEGIVGLDVFQQALAREKPFADRWVGRKFLQ